MTFRVWKYPWPLRPVVDQKRFMMPMGAKILQLHPQDDNLCIWALVDDDQPMEPRDFIMYGTGHELAEAAPSFPYVGTVHLNQGTLVLHVFEKP